MDAAFKFSVNGLNMEFTINLIAESCDVPSGLFIDILAEKCQLIHKHIKTSKDCLMMVANISNTVATIKLFDRDLEDSQLLYCTISNHTDLDEQLYRLWREVQGILRDHSINDHATKLCNIDTYYSSLEYEEMMHACLL